MKKIILTLVLIPILGLTTISFAQQGKWTIELSSGFRSEIFVSTDHGDATGGEIGTGKRLSFPQIEANFWYGIKDYFALESGLAFVAYNTNWSCVGEFMPKHKLYSALQIPLRARFSVPISKSNFQFFSTTGIILQFPLQSRIPNGWFPENDPYKDFYGEISHSWGKTNYRLISYAPMCGINILLNAKIGFMYKFDFGLGISVFGEYYKGTRTMVLIDAVYKEKLNSESDYGYARRAHYESKGDYWNTGIGISYSFKNGCKKKTD
jgi:hypothetical protein